jgi:hypothetical protein
MARGGCGVEGTSLLLLRQRGHHHPVAAGLCAGWGLRAGLGRAARGVGRAARGVVADAASAFGSYVLIHEAWDVVPELAAAEGRPGHAAPDGMMAGCRP